VVDSTGAVQTYSTEGTAIIRQALASVALPGDAEAEGPFLLRTRGVGRYVEGSLGKAGGTA